MLSCAAGSVSLVSAEAFKKAFRNHHGNQTTLKDIICEMLKTLAVQNAQN